MSQNDFCTYVDQKVKGFSSMRKNALPMHLFILWLLWLFLSVPTGLSALPAPLQSDALPLAGLDCTGERVWLVSEHSPLCLGSDTLMKTPT